MDIKFNFYKTYLEAIRGSAGSNIFRHLYLEMDGVEKDVAEDGELSCTIYVTWMLKIFNSDQQNIHLIKEARARVESAVKDLIESGWYEVSDPKPGAIILWGEHKTKSSLHKHLGFYVGDDKAISHRDYVKSPVEHKLHDEALGKVEKIFWHPRLDN